MANTQQRKKPSTSSRNNSPQRQQARPVQKAPVSKPVPAKVASPAKVTVTKLEKRFSLKPYFLLLGAFVGVLIGVVLTLVSGLAVLLPIYVVLGAGFGRVMYRRAAAQSFSLMKSFVTAQEIDGEDHPRLFNLLESLCAVSGVSVPVVGVTADATVNAYVVADPLGIEQCHVVFTEGALRVMERIELEGFVAACLARMKSGRLELQTETAGVVAALGKFIPSGLARKALEACFVTQDVFDSDIKACGITRFPPGLIAAYEKMSAESTVTSGVNPLNVHLWLANPRSTFSANSSNSSVSGASSSTVIGSEVVHPALATRLALLREI
jgi:heat shock protein HtpX